MINASRGSVSHTGGYGSNGSNGSVSHTGDYGSNGNNGNNGNNESNEKCGYKFFIVGTS